VPLDLWLGVGGVLWLRDGAALAGFSHDAELHALFLGFVFSMIVGRAPVIFPGVLGVAIPFRRFFYAHLALLHAGLALRVGGDLAGSFTAARWGGLLNETSDRALPARHPCLRRPRPSAARASLSADDGAAAGWSRTVSAAPATVATAELLTELRRLSVRLPVPQRSWHPHVRLVAACRNDLEQALALATDSPEAGERVAALVGGELELTFDPDASPELSAARRRLEALPIPDGQHPYLDEILPALEALGLLLVGLSHDGTT